MIKFLGGLVIVFIGAQAVFAQSGCGIQIGGKAVSLPKPVYSENIKFTKDFETVEVKIEIDEQGRVTSAKTISGNTDFASASETAALNSKFMPFLPKIKAGGILKYEFSSNTSLIKVSESITYDIYELRKRAGIECIKADELKYKSDYSIFNIVGRLDRKQAQPNSDEIGFVLNGKAKIAVRLYKINSRIARKLKSLGVEIISKISSENTIIGRIPIEKLEKLLLQPEIVYVFPFWTKSPPKSIV